MPITPVAPVSVGMDRLSGVGAAKPSGPNESFGNLLASGIDNLQQTQTQADTYTAKAAVGQLPDVHDLMIANTEATLATDLTVAVRNRAVESFNEIMRMQI
jgi:flagellar hook-basal body complex protein FliE